jgi:hypothetical protein
VMDTGQPDERRPSREKNWDRFCGVRLGILYFDPIRPQRFDAETRLVSTVAIAAPDSGIPPGIYAVCP